MTVKAASFKMKDGPEKQKKNKKGYLLGDHF